MTTFRMHAGRARRTRLLAALTLAACSAGAAVAKPPQPRPVDHLIERERAFARASAEKGMRDSFLEFIADDGIIFVPRPVAGRPLLAGGPAIPGRLEWTPSFAGIAASGDLGFTTGPYSMAANKDVTTGQYLTIWKKGTDGSWRFVLDRGTPGPATVDLKAAAAVTLLRGPRRARPESPAAGVLEAEQALSLASESSSARAIGGRLAPAARVLREGAAPAVTADARAELLRREPARVAYRVLGSGSSAAGDLAYAYGEASWDKEGKPVRGHFVRMWQREGREWRIVVDSRASVPQRPR